MTALLTTAVMKTDIRSSTPRFRSLREADLAALLAEHSVLVCGIAVRHDGRVVKGEGDAFWITFPSVTAAGLAAMAMQDELRRSQSNKGDDRISMRIVITLGDVLHEGDDIFGDPVALAAQIETITPADDIYISAAARLAVSQAEVVTTFVDAVPLKGFPELVPVYRMVQTPRTQIITDQYIVFTDLRGFGKFNGPTGVISVEKILNRLVELIREICREFAGAHRFDVGDASCMTFEDIDRALAAAERLTDQWDAFNRRERLGCSMVVAVHKGDLYLFRSHLYSNDVNIVSGMVDSTRSLSGSDSSIFVTGPIQREVAGTARYPRLRPVDLPAAPQQLAGLGVFRLEKP